MLSSCYSEPCCTANIHLKLQNSVHQLKFGQETFVRTQCGVRILLKLCVYLNRCKVTQRMTKTHTMERKTGYIPYETISVPKETSKVLQRRKVLQSEMWHKTSSYNPDIFHSALGSYSPSSKNSGSFELLTWKYIKSHISLTDQLFSIRLRPKIHNPRRKNRT